jgi:hypothetical protein
MTDMSKGRDQTKCNPWYSRLGVGRGDNNYTPGIFIVTKPWRRPRHTQGCSARKEERFWELVQFEIFFSLLKHIAKSCNV